MVFVTAHTDRNLFDRARSASPLGYVLKPFQEKQLQIDLDLAVRTIRGHKVRQSPASTFQCDPELISLAVESSDLALWDMDMTTRALTGSDRLYSILGYDQNEIEPTIEGWSRLFHPGDLVLTRQALKEHLEGTRRHIEVVFRLMTQNHCWRWFSARGKVVERFADDRPRRIVGTCLDITDQRRAEEALRKSEGRYKRLFEDAVLGIFRSTPSGRLLDVNPAFACMFGWDSPERLLQEVGNVAQDLYVNPPQRAALVERILDASFPTVAEKRFRRRDGSVFTGKMHAWSVRDAENDLLYLEGFIEDISEMELAEAALHESERFNRAIVSSSPSIIYIFDLDRKTNSWVNRTAVTEFHQGAYPGMEDGDLAWWGEWLPPEDHRRFTERLEELTRTEDGVWLELEYRFGNPDTGWKWYYDRASAFERDSSGRVVRIIASAVDVSRLKLTEKALRETEEKYRVLVEQSGDGIAVFQGRPPRLVFTNRRLVRIFGYSENELLIMSSRELIEMIHADDRAKVVEGFFNTHDLPESSQRFEFRIQTGFGRERYLEMSVKPVLLGGTASILACYRDHTEEKQAEEKILAGLKEKELLLEEIHHRVKNNMQILVSLMNLQAAKIDNPEALSVVRAAQSRVIAMAQIHNSLLSSTAITGIDLEQYLKSLNRRLLSAFEVTSGQIRFNFDIEPSLAVGLNQAMGCGLALNELITNSIKYAFTNGAVGEIAVAAKSLGESDIQIIVEDDGDGLPADLDWRSPPTLGLTLLTNLVKTQLGGRVEYTREKRTRFTITFPRA